MMLKLAACVAAVLLIPGTASAYQIPGVPVGCYDDGMVARHIDGGVRIIDRTREPWVASYRVDGDPTPFEVVGSALCIEGYTADRVRIDWAGDTGNRVRVAEFDADGKWLGTSWLRVRG